MMDREEREEDRLWHQEDGTLVWQCTVGPEGMRCILLTVVRILGVMWLLILLGALLVCRDQFGFVLVAAGASLGLFGVTLALFALVSFIRAMAGQLDHYRYTMSEEAISYANETIRFKEIRKIREVRDSHAIVVSGLVIQHVLFVPWEEYDTILERIRERTGIREREVSPGICILGSLVLNAWMLYANLSWYQREGRLRWALHPTSGAWQDISFGLRVLRDAEGALRFDGASALLGLALGTVLIYAAGKAIYLLLRRE